MWVLYLAVRFYVLVEMFAGIEGSAAESVCVCGLVGFLSSCVTPSQPCTLYIAVVISGTSF